MIHIAKSALRLGAALACLTMGGATLHAASNPIFKDAWTADPAPLVYKDTLYCYTGHDDGPDQGQGADIYKIIAWRCYSTKDMKTWTSHGDVLKPTDFKWGVKHAWAGQVVEKGGKFYYYVPLLHNDTHPGFAIGVAVADSPTGPFKDARGSALITDDMTKGGNWNDIDPTVFIDDDGTPWMAWGNGSCFMVKLKTNMTELDGPIQQVKLPRGYIEGPWLHKHNGTYYLIYAGFGSRRGGGGGGENIQYATAPKITGPWTARGELTGPAKNSFTIHPGVIDFKGQGYLFYHNATLELNGKRGTTGRRSVCVDYLYYNPDGTLQPVKQTVEGVDLPPNPKAETAATSSTQAAAK